MPRIKLTLPQTFSYSTQLTVRITDINYGGHLGNDAVLSLLHEARMRFLKSHGVSELDFYGASLIMSDVSIEFKAEAFYGHVLTAYVTAGEFTRVGFELFYKLVNEDANAIIAFAKTGMVCYDYDAKKVAAVPQNAKDKLLR